MVPVKYDDHKKIIFCVCMIVITFVTFTAKAYASTDIRYVPISGSAFISNITRSDVDERTMGIFIGQGVNSGYSIIAYSYFLSRVKESPKSAKMNLYLSWAAGSLWMFTGYGHSAIKNGSNQQKDLLKIELNSIATAYRLDPNSGIIVSDYGTVLWYQGRFNSNQSEMNKGMALLRQGVRLAPSLPNTHGALGLALEARDLGGKADNETISELQKAVELAPNNSCNHLYLGDAYLMNGDKEKASKEFSIATQLRGGEPMNPALFAKEPGSPWKGDMSISSPPLARNDHP